MLLRRIGLPFVGQQLKTTDQAAACDSRLDDLGPVRVSELLPVIGLQFLPFAFGIFRGLQILTEQDIHGTIRSHDSDLGGWISEVDIAPDMLGAHHVVSATVSLSGNDGHFRHGSLAIRIQ